FRSFLCSARVSHRALHSFPTRRSSDLAGGKRFGKCGQPACSRNRRSQWRHQCFQVAADEVLVCEFPGRDFRVFKFCVERQNFFRSEEHTSELQSRENLVCRLLLEKKKK